VFKAMILLTRRADMTRDDFVGWWLAEHAPRAAQLPGARRVVFNVVEPGGAEPGIDGISELWFDTQADFEAAYATEIGKAVAADSMAHVSGRVRLFAIENEIVGPGPG
jgi:uncharacterized protein (TIGR02118 family)